MEAGKVVAGQRGMTLVEISVGLAILGLLATVALPSILFWRHGLELRSAASEISGVLMQARTKAIVERKNYTVAFDEVADTYRTTPAGGPTIGRQGEPWKSVDVYDDDTDPACPTFSSWDVVFRPNSSADTAGFEAVYLRNPKVAKRYRVKVLGVTGRISVERWEGASWKSEY